MFHAEKRIVSSLETIFETNRYRRRDGEVVTLHPQTPYSSKKQIKGKRGDEKMKNKLSFNPFLHRNESILRM